MNSYKTAGIILRRIDYGEADRIYTILTPGGKVSAIAKGVRRIRAKLASHLDVFNEIELMLASGKNLDVVTSARSHTQFALAHDYERLRTGFLFLEMAQRLTDDAETEEVYTCLRGALEALTEHTPVVVELAFKLRMLEILGQYPELGITFDTHRFVQPDTSYYFDVSHGGLVEESGQNVPLLSPESVKLWRLCQRYDIADIARIKGANRAADESLHVCNRFYEYMYDIRFTAQDI